MLALIIIPLYLVGCGIAFTILGQKYSPNDYWETPTPFFGSLFWPIFIPMVIGGIFGKRFVGISSRKTKDEKRRDREIAEAEHRRRLAEIEAEGIAILEKAVGA